MALVSLAHDHTHRERDTCGEHLPESQPLVQLLEEAPVELVDGVDVGEEEGHQGFGHGVFFDHGAAEPLRAGEGQPTVDVYELTY